MIMKGLKFIPCLLVTLLTTPGFGQSNEDQYHSNLSPAIEVSVGAAILAEDAGTEVAFGFGLSAPLNAFKPRPDGPDIIINIECKRLPPRPDPWRDIPPIIVFQPNPIPDPWVAFGLSDLTIGATWILASSVGVGFDLSDRINVSGFFGGGFESTKGETTETDNGTFRTTNSTAPLLTYGATARIGLNRNLHAKVEAQFISTFEDNMNVIGPDGSVATFEADNMVTPIFSAGLGYRF